MFIFIILIMHMCARVCACERRCPWWSEVLDASEDGVAVGWEPSYGGSEI